MLKWRDFSSDRILQIDSSKISPGTPDRIKLSMILRIICPCLGAENGRSSMRVESSEGVETLMTIPRQSWLIRATDVKTSIILRNLEMKFCSYSFLIFSISLFCFSSIFCLTLSCWSSSSFSDLSFSSYSSGSSTSSFEAATLFASSAATGGGSTIAGSSA